MENFLILFAKILPFLPLGISVAAYSISLFTKNYAAKENLELMAKIFFLVEIAFLPMLLFHLSTSPSP